MPVFSNFIKNPYIGKSLTLKNLINDRMNIHGDIMGRRQTMMEKYKQQMKAYRKKRMKADNTPFLPADENVYVMDTLNPSKKIRAEVVKKRVKNHRTVIESLACPICGNPMTWDSFWEAFTCIKHGDKAIYEIIRQK